MGPREVFATIVEDRGPIGAHGRRLFTIAVHADPHEPSVFEMPEDDLTLDDRPKPTELDKVAVVDYLSNGGLTAILANRSGGRNPPRVWLTLNQLGNVTYTFDPERGIVGGAIVPRGASYDADRLFEPKVPEVATFLSCFGLSADEIDQVLRSFGRAP